MNLETVWTEHDSANIWSCFAEIYKILIDKEICSVLTWIVGVFIIRLSLTFFYFFKTKHLPQFHLIKAQFEAPRVREQKIVVQKFPTCEIDQNDEYEY